MSDVLVQCKRRWRLVLKYLPVEVRTDFRAAVQEAVHRMQKRHSQRQQQEQPQQQQQQQPQQQQQLQPTKGNIVQQSNSPQAERRTGTTGISANEQNKQQMRNKVKVAGTAAAVSAGPGMQLPAAPLKTSKSSAAARSKNGKQ
jgi:flagellar motor protein MotB